MNPRNPKTPVYLYDFSPFENSVGFVPVYTTRPYKSNLAYIRFLSRHTEDMMRKRFRVNPRFPLKETPTNVRLYRQTCFFCHCKRTKEMIEDSTKYHMTDFDTQETFADYECFRARLRATINYLFRVRGLLHQRVPR